MEFDYTSGYFPRACKRCKQLKRKCDKTWPKCRSCEKGHFVCSYQDSNESYPRHGPGLPTASLGASSDMVIRPPALKSESNISSDFPPIYFLDYQLYQRSIAELPRIPTAVPPDLEALTRDIRETSKVYFRRIHPWMPFLSKTLFNERLLSPFTPRGIDVSLLFACVNLICSVPAGETTRPKEYLVIKSALLEAEVAGVLSLRVFQAWILLCVYELGHAIYPSAYVSIGACAKYGAALGLNRVNTCGLQEASNWIEGEEKTRAWWAIVILDRFSNLGCPYRSLSTEEPESHTRLPIDDASWDLGVRKDQNIYTLSTPISPLMGRFGLMAQAASLLGRVLHHLSEFKNGTSFSSEEATILKRALAALVIVANEEGSARGIGVCTPTVLCLSARITLALHAHSKYPPLKDLNCDPALDIISSGVAYDVTRLCQWALSKIPKNLDEEVSPFPLSTTYYTAAAYVNLYYKENKPEYLERVSEFKTLLRICNERWKVAGVYLKMIEAREAISMNSLPLP